MKKATTTFLSLVVCVFLFAQGLDKKMHELVDAYAKTGKFNGTVLVSHKGKIVYQAGFGYRDAENKVLHEADDIFQIGSITKQITAAVIMQLQEEGKLSVQDKLSKYFPGFVNGDKITIEHLLTHTSGIYNYTDDETLMNGDVTRNYTQSEMVALFKGYKPDFEPGTKWKYSNSAYSLLGYIIEKVTGKPYEALVRERIFSPLGMTSSGFDFTHLVHPRKSKGYYSLAAGKPLTAPVVDSTIAYSAGAVYSTVGDLAKWERAITEGKILQPASWKSVFTPFKNKYGYGWIIDSALGRQYVGHGGGIHGFASYLIRFPQDELSVMMIDNASSPHLGKISKALAAIAFGHPYDLPKQRQEIPIDAVVLPQYAGKYQMTPTFSITVTADGKKLKAQATGQPQFEMYAEKKDFFFLKVVDAQIEFIRDEAGKVTELILHQNGIKQTARKIK